MWLAAIDPQWPPIIAALATLATALGLSERRRRKEKKDRDDYSEAVDRQAAETILTQWKAVLEAAQARAEWAEDRVRRCEERGAILTARVDELDEKIRNLEWEKARLDWLMTQPRKRRVPDE